MTRSSVPRKSAADDCPVVEKIHEHQLKVARSIFDKIRHHFQGMKSFDFRIVVPARLSLESQTISRLQNCGIFDGNEISSLPQRVVKALIPKDWEQSSHKAARDWRQFVSMFGIPALLNPH
jgi:hypothetical protein